MTGRVAVIGLGGTIAMTPSPAGGGAVPTASAEQLLGAVPGLTGIAELEVQTYSVQPSASLSIADLLGVLDLAGRAVVQGAQGVVVVQGTDTLEESAYLLDLLWPHDQPLVLTGAMRTPAQLSPDGPANLAGAVRTAASQVTRGLGALVVLAEQIHAARRVRKRATVWLDAFSSGPFGPLGRLHEGTLTLANRITRAPVLPRPARTDVRVALLEAALGDRGELLRLVTEDRRTDGVVVAGFGAGHVAAAYADAVAAAAVPVVLCSRTGSGPLLTSTYGFAGSERDLVDRGAIPAGWLDARKARLLLTLLLGNGAGRGELCAALARHGTMP